MSTKQIIFIHPNTEDGANSKKLFLQEIEKFEIWKSVQCIPCLESKNSIGGNIDIIRILKPQIIILSNEFTLDLISRYTDILFKIVQDERNKLYKSFFILTYKNQNFVAKETTTAIFKEEVHEYYHDLQDMVSDLEQQILNLKAFQER
jgi:hypothetical protein